MHRAVALGVELLCSAGSQSIWRKDVQDGSSSYYSIFCKSHALKSSSDILGHDASRILGGFGAGGGNISLQLYRERGSISRTLGVGGQHLMQVEVFADVCSQLGEITNSDEALREIWRQITGTGRAMSHNVMHMQHKHGHDNQLAAALQAWLEEQFMDVAGDGDRCEV